MDSHFQYSLRVYTDQTTEDFLAFTCLFLLLKTFASSLDPDQALQKAGFKLDQNCLTLWWYSRKKFSENKQTNKRQYAKI